MFITISKNEDGKELTLFKVIKIGYGLITDTGIWLMPYIGIGSICLGITFSWSKTSKINVDTTEAN
jgi:hypothetical protein